MKLSTFSYFVPLLVVAQIVAGGKPTSALLSSNEIRSQSMLTRLNGGALKRKQEKPVYQFEPDLSQASNTYHNRAALTQGRVAFVPDYIEQAPPAKSEGGPQSLWGKVKNSFRSKGGLSLKDRLAKKGFAAFLTFTFLSNITSMSCLSFAWYAFSVQTGMSPLFPGQWKPFLAVLAGSMAADAATKPIRLAVSLALAPMSSKAMAWLQRKCNGSKRLALGIAFAGIIGSAFGLLGAGVGLASSLSGVPIFAP